MKRCGLSSGTLAVEGERGFTLIELMIAMALMAMMGLALYGVIALGAQSAGSGERITEQARRLRIATSIVTRQLRSTEPIKLETEDGREPFFLGESDRVEFVTTAPQKPDASGLALVRYWLEDGAFMMSEVPIYSLLAGKDAGLDLDSDELGESTALLYDVDDLTFQYIRDAGRAENWDDDWDAAFVEELPAAVKISVESDLPDGPNWYHEIPIIVGAYNALMGEDDFARTARRGRAGGRKKNDEDDEDDSDGSDDSFEDDDFDE